jgi:hypothetical protein
MVPPNYLAIGVAALLCRRGYEQNRADLSSDAKCNTRPRPERARGSGGKHDPTSEKGESRRKMMHQSRGRRSKRLPIDARDDHERIRRIHNPCRYWGAERRRMNHAGAR